MTLLLALAACGTPPVEAPPPSPPADVVERPTKWLAPDAPSPLRRLTGAQYNRTLEDLFVGADLPTIVFPTDEEVAGFDHMAATQAVSPLLIEALQYGAVTVTAAAMETPAGWLPCPEDGGPDPEACGRDFLADFATRAYRRPLSDDEEAFVTDLFAEVLAAEGDFRVAVSVGIQACLLSPEFLYLLEPGDDDDDDGARAWLTDHEVATRLSYLLWGTMPDRALRAAADRGDLSTPDQVEAEAWRMLDHANAVHGTDAFFHQWLDLDDVDRIFPYFGTYPDHDPSWNAHLRAEVEDLVHHAWDGQAPTLQSLLLDRTTDIDEVLAQIYDLPEGASALPADQRAGVLTRAGWLGAKAHTVQPSPVERGVFVLDRLLCQPPSAPPADVDTSVVGFQFAPPSTTNRQQYEQHVADPACAGCHQIIDPLGFSLEHYDGLGQWRDTEGNDLPTDATGSITAGDLAGTAIDGGVELSEALAASDTVRACFATQWTRFALARLETQGDLGVWTAIEDASMASGGDLRPILIDIVRSEAFRSRPALP